MDRVPRPEDEESFRPLLREYLPTADGPTLSMGICLYCNTVDGHFVLDRHPAHENVLVAAGFTGHGFKFAPVVGQAMADLALDGTTSLPIEFLGLSRFTAVR
jgi:sarcosine oxidase